MNTPTLTTQNVEIVTGCEVVVIADKIRADMMWRAFFRDLDALQTEMDKPHYERRFLDVINSEAATLMNMIREIRPIVGFSEKTMEEMFNEYFFH